MTKWTSTATERERERKNFNILDWQPLLIIITSRCWHWCRRSREFCAWFSPRFQNVYCTFAPFDGFSLSLSRFSLRFLYILSKCNAKCQFSSKQDAFHIFFSLASSRVLSSRKSKQNFLFIQNVNESFDCSASRFAQTKNSKVVCLVSWGAFSRRSLFSLFICGCRNRFDCNPWLFVMTSDNFVGSRHSHRCT